MEKNIKIFIIDIDNWQCMIYTIIRLMKQLRKGNEMKVIIELRTISNIQGKKELFSDIVREIKSNESLYFANIVNINELFEMKNSNRIYNSMGFFIKPFNLSNIVGNDNDSIQVNVNGNDFTSFFDLN